MFCLCLSSLRVCQLTEASCEDLVIVLTSGAPQLHVCDISFNKFGDQGLVNLCKGLHSHKCELQQLKYVLFQKRTLIL